MSADGTWNITMNTPMGAQPGTLTLKTSGDSLEGKLESTQGAQDIADGKVDGNSLSWNVNMTQPMAMKLEFTATLDGDKISGNVSLGSFGNATFEGTRA
ncbi:MAG: hypothetical protein V3V67_02615 [Myxococcota bacterium]